MRMRGIERTSFNTLELNEKYIKIKEHIRVYEKILMMPKTPIDYSKTIIYKIEHIEDDNLVYVR